MRPRIVVVGSINLDLVVRVPELPRPGETVGGGTFSRIPGGKGANQAMACARLGADVTMVGAIGRDAAAEDALAGLRQADVTLRLEQSDEHTGVALIQVDATGETTIAVAPGANAALGPVELPAHDAVLCQLEIPDEAVLSAWEGATGMFCLNAGPARPIEIDPDLTVVNRFELDTLSRRDGLVAVTLGAEGAVLLDDGEEIARAAPPASTPSTGPRPATRSPPVCSSRCSRSATRTRRSRARAPPGRSRRHASAHSRRCRRRRRSTRSSAPTHGDNRTMPTPIVLDCDPGHDDAIALLLALGSPELELLGVTTTYGNQTLEKTTANALRVLELAGRTDVPVARGRRRAARARARRRRARPRRERPRRADVAAAERRAGRGTRRWTGWPRRSRARPSRSRSSRRGR